MCGIAGIIGIEDTERTGSALQKMLNKMAHRGPDNEAMFVESGVGLGHRRLSILDLSEAGNQPMADPTGRYQIILNGEVYNYKEIRSHLKRKEYFTGTDTETLLAAYIEKGPDCLELFNGMFTIAIWDREEQTCFIARDRLGIKPLYYFWREGVLVFGSEVRGVLASELVPRKLNRAVLGEYLAYQTVMAPSTLVEGVMLMKAGQFGIYKEGEFDLKTWWDAASSAGESKAKKKRVHEL